MEKEKQEAIDAAISKAQAEKAAWTTETFEELLALMEKLVGGPVRSKLTEIWVAGESVLAIARPGPHLTLGTWEARTGTSGDQPTLFVVVVVDDATFAALRGRSPDEWTV